MPVEEQQWCYLTHSREDKGLFTFPKVNVKTLQEFELTNFKATVQHFSHYAT